MPELAIGKAAPDFTIATDRGEPFQLSAHRGRQVVLTFYSDGTTEGCALQNSEFTALMPEFEAAKVTVIAIAPQPAKACEKMRARHSLTHLLGADPDLKVLRAYGLWQQKKLWGHEYLGVVRTSVVVDAAGKVAAIIPAKRIKGHALRVLDATRALTG
jgi:thioredoxin-dependent peroxiredoxin